MSHSVWAQGALMGGTASVRKIALALARYKLRQVNQMLEGFDRDILLAVLLGEIALHNLHGLEDDPDVCRRMRPCNAYSVAASTGIPRETVRRKVARLVELGWIEKRPGGHLFVTPAAIQHFEVEFVDQGVSELLAAADELRGLEVA